MDIQTKVDRLGELLNMANSIGQEVSAIKAELKDLASILGPKTPFQGTRFIAIVSETERKSTDWKTIVADLKVPQKTIEKYTTVGRSQRIDVKEYVF